MDRFEKIREKASKVITDAVNRLSDDGTEVDEVLDMWDDVGVNKSGDVIASLIIHGMDTDGNDAYWSVKGWDLETFTGFILDSPSVPDSQSPFLLEPSHMDWAHCRQCMKSV